MKILHCVIDEKFIYGTIRVYESDHRHQNRFVLFSKDQTKEFKYIKSDKVEVHHPSELSYICNDFDVVILHSFNCISPRSIIQIPEKCIVVWYGWGYDYYEGNPPIVKTKMYNKETWHFLFGNHLKKKLWNIIHFKSYFTKYQWKKRALSRIDYFSGVFPYEFDLVKSLNNCFKAKPLDFYYGDVDFFIKKEYDKNIDHNKCNIIIGNSADPSNNHHDVLTYLSRVKLPSESKIILPLSYAGTEKYNAWISDYANDLFPNRAILLQDFLPINEYLQLISRCKVAIFFHERQQASDNIFMQIMYGAKVYMSETSLAYRYLKSKGFVLFSLQKDWKTMMEDLSDDAIINNRKLLSELYSSEAVIQRVLHINDTLEYAIKSKHNNRT